jgi:hypothetical protein
MPVVDDAPARSVKNRFFVLVCLCHLNPTDTHTHTQVMKLQHDFAKQVQASTTSRTWLYYYSNNVGVQSQVQVPDTHKGAPPITAPIIAKERERANNTPRILQSTHSTIVPGRVHNTLSINVHNCRRR